MMTVAWLSADSSTDSLSKLMYRLKDLSRSVLGFLFERFVTLSVLDAGRAAVSSESISGFSQNISSAERAILDAELKSINTLMFPTATSATGDWFSWKLVGPSSLISIKPTKLVVVEGTTTKESTYSAIVEQVKTFNKRVKTGEAPKSECVYLAFDYDRTFCVDGCVVFLRRDAHGKIIGPTHVIPMQLTIALEKYLDTASDWVIGLREELARENVAASVSAFCVVRPARSDTGLFRTDTSTVVSSPKRIPQCPIVIFDFNYRYVATGLRSSLFTLDSVFMLMIQKACENMREKKEIKKKVAKLPNCYPRVNDK
jgi:hypothetical protein